ncbi:hypothetical protein N431DRAFT_181793 [Stipitochalara longipes BDJ]|nr:hypothetical protein N431DRAFT_181793 [Stipitochalara longipes BDJ]
MLSLTTPPRRPITTWPPAPQNHHTDQVTDTPIIQEELCNDSPSHVTTTVTASQGPMITWDGELTHQATDLTTRLVRRSRQYQLSSGFHLPYQLAFHPSVLTWPSERLHNPRKKPQWMKDREAASKAKHGNAAPDRHTVACSCCGLIKYIYDSLVSLHQMLCSLLSLRRERWSLRHITPAQRRSLKHWDLLHKIVRNPLVSPVSFHFQLASKYLRRHHSHTLTNSTIRSQFAKISSHAGAYSARICSRRAYSRNPYEPTTAYLLLQRW